MTETTETNERSKQSISALLMDGWKIILTFCIGGGVVLWFAIQSCSSTTLAYGCS